MTVTDPASAVLGVINQALKFATSGLEVYQTRITAKAKELERQESRASEAVRRQEERQLARAEYIRARRDKREDYHLELQAAKDLDRSRVELHSYPLRAGPGALRRSVAMLAQGRDEPPLVVLFLPARDDSDAAWRVLPVRLQAALMSADGLDAVMFCTDQPLTWPHVALIENDLYDLPTIVVSAEVITGRLSLGLGGCNLGGDDVVRKFRQIVWWRLPSSAHWTETRLAMLESTSRDGFLRPPVESPKFEQELQLEWATRLAMVGMITAIDAYHLLRRRGYREHLDDAIAVLEPELVPASVPISLGALADPAYHLMHQAKRQVAAHADKAAATSVSAAIQALSGDQNLPLPEAVVAAWSARRLESWHREMLEELAKAAPGRGVVPEAVLTALRRPVTDAGADAEPHPADPPQPEALASPGRRWQRRPVTETRGTPNEESSGPWRGRPISEIGTKAAETPRDKW